jgi:hypothetical protein
MRQTPIDWAKVIAEIEQLRAQRQAQLDRAVETGGEVEPLRASIHRLSVMLRIVVHEVRDRDL